MKKSGIALLLTLSLILTTVLGCFVLPAAAEESAQESAAIVSYDASLVGPELQVAVNATNAAGYKLYEGDALVCESTGPILTYMGYSSEKAYTIGVVDKDGELTQTVAIDHASIASVAADSSYTASNLLLGKVPTFTANSLGYANTVESVKDPLWMFDGDLNTRYSTVARNVEEKNPNIDFTVSLDGSFALGELKVYDFDGTRRCMGHNLVIEIYADGEWKKIVELDKDQIAAAYQGSGMKNGHLLVDLTGYRAEAIRFYNYGLPINTTDAISFWEISLSGIMTADFSEYEYSAFHADYVPYSDNLFAGRSFYLPAEANVTWVSGTTTPISNLTDGKTGTIYKANGKLIYDMDFSDVGYAVIDNVTVTFSKNTGVSSAGGANRHYNIGADIIFEAYFAGEWKEVYKQTFTTNVGPTLTFDLNGILAERLRYRCTSTATPYNMYDADGNVAGTSVENSVGIAEMTAAGKLLSIPESAVANQNVFLGKEFIPTADAEKAVWAGNPYSNLTNGNKTGDRFATNGLAITDATLTIGGVALLYQLEIVYESAARSGIDLLVEVIYAGKTYTVINEAYEEGAATRIFNLGGVPAEKVRVYISKGFAEGNCTSIREISCSAILDTTVSSNTNDNVLKGVSAQSGPAATAVNAANYGYQTLTDGSKAWTKIDGVEYGRFSTRTIQDSNSLQTVCLDASFSVDENLDLGTLRIYDFNPTMNKFGGKHLEISARINGLWRTLFALEGDDIYACRVSDYLAFDLGGVNATEIRIVLKSNRGEGTDISVSVYEIELSATRFGKVGELAAKDEAANSVYTEGNILEGIPAENLSVNCSMNGDYPLSLAFDGIIEPDMVNGTGSKNRYSTNGANAIKDADGNQIGSAYTLTIDLKNNAPLNVLSIYEWRGGGTINRSSKTKVEVMINNAWVVLYTNVPLSSTSSDRTDFDLHGIVASGIRITFVNDHYEGAANVGWWSPATIKEITCTSAANLGNVADAYEALAAVTPSDEFGVPEIYAMKIADEKAELATVGTDAKTLIAKIAALNTVTESFQSGGAPITDEYGDFTQANISLKGNIGFNFYGALDEGVEEQFPNATVVVSYESVLDGAATTNTEARSLSELERDGNGRYVLEFDLAAAQMTDSVEIRIVFDGDNCGEHISWSIKDYCENILAGDYEQSLKDVVNAMLTYGAYAQSYFGYNTDKLAADISGELPTVTENAKPTATGAVTGVTMSGWTLALDSNVTMKLYFVLDGVNPEDLTVTVTAPNGEVTTLDTLEQVGSRYRVTVSDITSGYLNDNYVVTITSGGEALTVSSSAMCYVSAILANENSDPALVNLVTALKLYSVAADSYFGK
ncbi:MAG: hypothetical protein IKL79_07020 [Clostridia bacterium]|nr:hypothetical protein [Clostridia bacterium]